MSLNGRPSTIVLLATLTLIAFSSCADIVMANVPDVIQVQNVSYGSTIKLEVQISHANPTSSHYVDKLEMIGTWRGFQRDYTYPQSPQTTDPFTSEVSLDVADLIGDVPLDQVQVQVRAHCNVHGWSAWTPQITLPELSLTIPILIVVLSSVLLAVRLPGTRRQRATTVRPSGTS